MAAMLRMRAGEHKSNRARSDARSRAVRRVILLVPLHGFWRVSGLWKGIIEIALGISVRSHEPVCLQACSGRGAEAFPR